MDEPLDVGGVKLKSQTERKVLLALGLAGFLLAVLVYEQRKASGGSSTLSSLIPTSTPNTAPADNLTAGTAAANPTLPEEISIAFSEANGSTTQYNQADTQSGGGGGGFSLFGGLFSAGGSGVKTGTTSSAYSSANPDTFTTSVQLINPTGHDLGDVLTTLTSLAGTQQQRTTQTIQTQANAARDYGTLQEAS